VATPPLTPPHGMSGLSLERDVSLEDMPKSPVLTSQRDITLQDSQSCFFITLLADGVNVVQVVSGNEIFFQNSCV